MVEMGKEKTNIQWEGAKHRSGAVHSESLFFAPTIKDAQFIQNTHVTFLNAQSGKGNRRVITEQMKANSLKAADGLDLIAQVFAAIGIVFGILSAATKIVLLGAASLGAGFGALLAALFTALIARAYRNQYR